MIEQELLTVKLNDVSFDVYFDVTTFEDNEKAFELMSIELTTSAENIVEFLDSRVVENLEKLAIAKYVKNQNEVRDDD